MPLTTTPTDNGTRKSIRRELRARRRSLGRSERRRCEHAIERNLRRMRVYQRARRIAVYFSVDGEVNLHAIIAHARACGKSVFAPTLARDGLRFVEIRNRSVYRINRFGILEPGSGRRMDPRGLDLVLAPLVAFDSRGNRLGMGKGYYDRSFGFLGLRTHWRKPKLIGIGFDFQKVGRLTRSDWDVPLWSAVTNAGIDYFEDRTNDELLASKV